ncbi:MAG TPA: ABC transporter ATP-binding protein, partial [Pirellulales bacterium]
AIARALVAEPAIVLADEPTGALDTVAGDRVISILRSLVSEQGQTVVMVTHDLSVAQRADRIIQVRDGQIFADHDQRDPAVLAQQASEHSA